MLASPCSAACAIATVLRGCPSGPLTVIQLPAASPATVPAQHVGWLSFEGAREAVLARDEQHDNDDDHDDDDDDDDDDDGNNHDEPASLAMHMQLKPLTDCMMASKHTVRSSSSTVRMQKKAALN